MPQTRGLDVPVRPSRQGGATLADGTDQLIKVIALALAAGDDDNPFQDVGIKEDLVFQIDSEGNRGVARQRVRRILAKFADRVALDPKSDIKITSKKGEPGAVRAQFRVIDLATDKPIDFDTQLG